MDKTEITETLGKLTTAERRRQLFIAIGVMAGIALVVALIWMLVWSKREVTDNAYVGGHQVLVSARTAGTVRAVYVEDTETVRAGQLLVELEADDAKVALNRARADLKAAIGQAKQCEATFMSRATELKTALADLRRREPLERTRAMSPEALQHARDRVAIARASLAAARAAWQEGGIATQPGVVAARAAYVAASLNYQRTRIVAPVDGIVVQRTVQAGQQTQAGLPLLRLVPLQGLWIDANFKETELPNVRIGQPAKVIVDLYGSGTTFEGRVAGFSGGTGAAFAVLPPQNAAGNWVKVVQRVPVRIELNQAQLKQYPLRLGLSAHVSIDTHDRKGPLLRQPSARESGSPERAASADLQRAEQEAQALIDQS